MRHFSPKRNTTLRKIFQYIRAHRVYLVLSILFAAITAVLTLYVPILFGDAIDGIIRKGQVDFPLIGSLLLEIAILCGVTALLQWLMNVINNRITYHVVRDIRRDAFNKIQKLPLSYLDSHSSGDIVSRVIADADTFADGLLMGFSQLFTGVVTIIATLVFMLTLHVGITLLVVVLTPLSLFMARFIARRTYHLFRKQSETRGRQTALIDEMIGNQKVVKAFGYEKEAVDRFDVINEELQDCSTKAVFYSSITNPSTRFINSVIYAAVALAGAFAVLTGGLTVGGLTCLLSYANQYTKPFNDISSVITELQNSLACASRLFELIEAPSQAPDGPMEMPTAKGEVTLEHVYFRYTPQRPLIDDLHLTVKPGMKVAIVGPTGCGKTTVINLLMRFYDVNEGAVLLDGVDIRQMTRHSLRRNYGMVLQETWLKNGTVRENLKMGRDDATDEEMIAAAKATHSHEFIRRLPQGYDTVLQEDSLSQGQKQLLCITRVMLCRPPVLILDEATSSIDTRTEVLIQEAFARLMEGRTSFIVAHRLSTIRNADCILVMKDGHILEQGTHEDLLAGGGFYAELYNSQFAGKET